MLASLILLSLIFFKETASNLIINGDFQDYYDLNFQQYQDIRYAGISSPFPTWYTQNSNFIEIQQIFYPDYTTLGVDLSSSAPMTLCQNINLQNGSKYRLSFSLYTYYFQNMTAFVIINGIIATQLFIPDMRTFANQMYQFHAKSKTNKICFNETHLNQTPTSDMGGLVDNISLVLIESTIMFQQSISQENSKITLYTNLSYSQYHAIVFMNTCTIFLEGTAIEYQLRNSTQGKLQVQIYYNFTFNQNTLHIVANSNLSMVDLNIYFRNPLKKKYYHKLSKNQILILEDSKTFLSATARLTKKVQSLSKVFFFTYFISSVVDSQTICLFYIFNKIRIVPEFLKNFYYQILTIIFSASNSVQFIQKWFEIPQVIDLPMQSTFKEKIPVQKDEQPWFGVFDLSSRFISSNITNAFSLVFLIIKYRVFKLILRCIRNIVADSAKEKFRIKFKLTTLLLNQFCFMAPTIIIQLMANILNSVNSYQQKNYKAACVVFLSFIIGCLFLYIFTPSIQKRKEKIKTASKHKKTLGESIRPQEKIEAQKVTGKNIEYSYESLTTPLLFLIPFAVYIDSVVLFLVFNGFVVVFRIIAFFKLKFENVSSFQRKVTFINIVLWVTHHTIFTVFWICQKDSLNQRDLDFIKNLGFASIITVLMIFLIEIIRFLMTIFGWIKWSVKFPYSLYKIYREESMEDRQKQVTQKLKGDSKDKRNIIFIKVSIKRVDTKSQKEDKIGLSKNKNKIKKQKVTKIENSSKRQNQKL